MSEIQNHILKKKEISYQVWVFRRRGREDKPLAVEV